MGPPWVDDVFINDSVFVMICHLGNVTILGTPVITRTAAPTLSRLPLRSARVCFAIPHGGEAWTIFKWKSSLEI